MAARWRTLSMNTAARTSGRRSGPSRRSGGAARVSLDLRRLEERWSSAALLYTLRYRYERLSTTVGHPAEFRQLRKASDTMSEASSGPTRPVANRTRSSACFRKTSASASSTPIRCRSPAHRVTSILTRVLERDALVWPFAGTEARFLGADSPFWPMSRDLKHANHATAPPTPSVGAASRLRVAPKRARCQAVVLPEYVLYP